MENHLPSVNLVSQTRHELECVAFTGVIKSAIYCSMEFLKGFCSEVRGRVEAYQEYITVFIVSDTMTHSQQ